jgi:ceramide glucosyltransferase
VIWLGLPALAAAAYYLLAIAGAARWPRSGRGDAAAARPVSLLKPVHGTDPNFARAIRSHARQDYPEFEMIFGVSDRQDAAVPEVERLAREFPHRHIRVEVVPTAAPNVKAGVLAGLAKAARYEFLLVNDSDITVPPGYLKAVTAPLEDPRIGLVTCLYRGVALSWASRFEALGIATEFAPSVMVARLLGVAEFALGSTMVFRAAALEKVGGFEAISAYLADDYQLGRRITELGYHVAFAPVVVETWLGAASWIETWRHQLRWSRTIRVSRPSGYYGYGITHATVWALVAFGAGKWGWGIAALATRLLAGLIVGRGILQDREVLRWFWLMPVRDLFGFAVWVAGLFGRQVDWGDRTLRLENDGRIA